MTITQTQAHAIAKAIHAIRSDWDPAGILVALSDCQTRNPADTLIAFAKAATVPTNRTPAVAALAGPHWATTNPASAADRHPSAVPIAELCDTCGRSEPWCRAVPNPNHHYQPRRPRRPDTYANGAAAARQALAQAHHSETP